MTAQPKSCPCGHLVVEKAPPGFGFVCAACCSTVVYDPAPPGPNPYTRAA